MLKIDPNSLERLETLMNTLPKMIREGQTQEFLDNFKTFQDLHGDLEYCEFVLMEVAIRKDNIKVLEALFQDNERIRQYERKLLVTSADEGSFEVLRWLLEVKKLDAQLFLKTRAYNRIKKVKKIVDDYLPKPKSDSDSKTESKVQDPLQIQTNLKEFKSKSTENSGSSKCDVKSREPYSPYCKTCH